MSSRPLFISVAESMVILPPIAQVGCLSASSTVTPSRSARARPRNGPRDAVRVGQRDPAHAEAPRLLDERLPRALGARPGELELTRARDDVERLGADRAGRAEDQETAGHGPQGAKPSSAAVNPRPWG